MSCSFDPSTLLCHCCDGGPHNIIRQGEDGHPEPALIICSDQAFPAMLPAMQGKCAAIIRVEDAAPSELIFAVRNILGGKKIPVGSAVMLSSLSHLGVAGTAKYVQDIAAAMKTLEDDYAGRVRILHGYAVPKICIADPLLIRGISDVIDWLHETDRRHSYHLPAVNIRYREIFLTGDEHKNPLATIPIPMALPASIRRRDPCSFCSGGNPGLADTIPIATAEKEAEFINSLFEEINSELAMNLDTWPSMNPVQDSQDTGRIRQLIVGGGSHASRLAESLGVLYPDVIDLSLCGWKLTGRSADELADDICDAIQKPDQEGVVIILELFDSSAYKGTEKGDRATHDPFRIGNTYHVQGKLAVCVPSEFKYLFAAAASIIRACRKATVFLLSPIYRYLNRRCCEDPSHLTNSEDPTFPARLAQSLRDMHKLLRSLVWHKHWRNVKVVNPAIHMGLRPDSGHSLEEEEARMAELLARWGDDPIHPTEIAYKQLAEALLNMGADAQPPAQMPARANNKRVASPTPLPDNRPQWVRHNSTDVVASRFSDRRDRAGPSGNAGQRDGLWNPGHPRGNAGARGYQRTPRHLSGNAGVRGGYSGHSGSGGQSGNAGRHEPAGKRYRRGH